MIQAILDQLDSVVYARDLDGRYLYVNESFCAVFRRPREEIVDRNAAEILPAAMLAQARDHDRTVMDERRARRFVERLELADGVHELETTRFPVEDDSGKLIAVAGVSADVTEKRRLEGSLRESEEKFRLAFHANPMAINLNRLSDGAFLDINEGFTRLMGYTREDVAGRSSLELSIWVDPADRQGLVKSLRESGRVDGLRAQFRRKNGDIGIGVMSARVITIRGETVVLSLTSDVTQEVQLEERYRQAQKMEAIGRLAGGVAHDFNNLLIPIMSYAEMVKETLGPSDERRQMLDEILHAGTRAAGLTRQILAFSRKQILDMRPLDIGALVADLRALLERLLPATIVLRTECPTGILARGDRTQIEQILLNLAVNAADAMPGGGTLTVEVHREALDGAMTGGFIEKPQPGSYAAVAVRDTGVGMDGSTLQHIFEPFFTTKEQGKGTGLGLATVFGIVKQHGGHVWVSSEPGLGTTFRVYLPLCEDGSAAGAVPREAPVAGGWERVLVVEDEAVVRTLVSQALADNGYQVLVAENAAAALRMGEQGALDPAPAMLLTDIVMPGLNGRELHEILRSRIPHLRVLFMSGYAEEVIGRHGAIDAGFNFLQKPFDINGLLRAVRRVLDG